jgi:hypothetical protein
MVRPSKVVMCGTPFSPNLAARTLQSLYCNAHKVTSFKKWSYPTNKHMEITRGRRSKGPSSLLLKWALPTALHNGAHTLNPLQLQIEYMWKLTLYSLGSSYFSSFLLLLMILLELFEDFFIHFPINFRCLHISQNIFIIPF